MPSPNELDTFFQKMGAEKNHAPESLLIPEKVTQLSVHMPTRFELMAHSEQPLPTAYELIPRQHILVSTGYDQFNRTAYLEELRVLGTIWHGIGSLYLLSPELHHLNLQYLHTEEGQKDPSGLVYLLDSFSRLARAHTPSDRWPIEMFTATSLFAGLQRWRMLGGSLPETFTTLPDFVETLRETRPIEVTQLAHVKIKQKHSDAAPDLCLSLFVPAPLRCDFVPTYEQGIPSGAESAMKLLLDPVTQAMRLQQALSTEGNTQYTVTIQIEDPYLSRGGSTDLLSAVPVRHFFFPESNHPSLITGSDSHQESRFTYDLPTG